MGAGLLIKSNWDRGLKIQLRGRKVWTNEGNHKAARSRKGPRQTKGFKKSGWSEPIGEKMR